MSYQEKLLKHHLHQDQNSGLHTKVSSRTKQYPSVFINLFMPFILKNSTVWKIKSNGKPQKLFNKDILSHNIYVSENQINGSQPGSVLPLHNRQACGNVQKYCCCNLGGCYWHLVAKDALNNLTILQSPTKQQMSIVLGMTVNQISSTQTLPCMRITRRAYSNRLFGPTPQFLIPQVWGGTQELAFLTSSKNDTDTAGLRNIL